MTIINLTTLLLILLTITATNAMHEFEKDLHYSKNWNETVRLDCFHPHGRTGQAEWYRQIWFEPAHRDQIDSTRYSLDNTALVIRNAIHNDSGEFICTLVNNGTRLAVTKYHVEIPQDPIVKKRKPKTSKAVVIAPPGTTSAAPESRPTNESDQESTIYSNARNRRKDEDSSNTVATDTAEEPDAAATRTYIGSSNGTNLSTTDYETTTPQRADKSGVLPGDSKCCSTSIKPILAILVICLIMISIEYQSV